MYICSSACIYLSGIELVLTLSILLVWPRVSNSAYILVYLSDIEQVLTLSIWLLWPRVSSSACILVYLSDIELVLTLSIWLVWPRVSSSTCIRVCNVRSFILRVLKKFERVLYTLHSFIPTHRILSFKLFEITPVLHDGKHVPNYRILFVQFLLVHSLSPYNSSYCMV